MTRQRASASSATPPEASDDLKRIRGIGPSIERRLHSAGIRTFADLAALSAEAIASCLPNLSAKQIITQAWIPQARKLVPSRAKAVIGNDKSKISATHQHYDNFTIEFLLDEKNKTRRIRVVHVQSGDVDTWTRWDAQRLFDFLARHTGARLSYAKSAVHTTSKSKLTPKQSLSTEQSSERSSETTENPPVGIVPQQLAPLPSPAGPIDKIRLLKWKTLIGKINQLTHNIPHDQTFDVNLTLDLTSAALSETSRLDLTGVLYAKKLGNGHRQAIGETRMTMPYASTVDLTITNSSLTEGLYRLEVLLTLLPMDPTLSTSAQSRILSSFQGGLFQVY
jgi:hypothetical protein